MAMESFATPYPLFFHDGEQEHDKGHIGIHSVLTFKRFQGIMCQKIGIPANQLSAVFVCRRTLKDTEKRQKLPINENTNFNIILNQHNPSRERDCHFLVSMKKSKKERKGTRKRSTEAENADDDDSASSRGDLSPSDERPKSGSVKDEGYLTESSSPTLPLHRPTSPVTVLPALTNGHKASSNGSPPNGKAPSVDGKKIERTLLRREGLGQNGFASPRSNWHNGAGVSNQRVEGFSVCSTVKVENRPPLQVQHNSNVQQEDQQGDQRKTDKKWASEDSSLQAKAGPTANGQLQQRQVVPHVELLHQERFSDAVPQAASPVQRNGVVSSTGSPRSPAGIGRNGATGPGVGSAGSQGQVRNGGFGASPVVSRANPMPSSPSARPSISSIVASGNFMPRVTNSGGASGNSGSNGAILHQAQQAHLLHSFHQQHASHVSLTTLEFSKFTGVLRGLVGDLRGEGNKMCRLCSHYAERNIRPAPFHSCVHDRIISGFRGPSPAGPIERPVKRRVEAAS